MANDHALTGAQDLQSTTAVTATISITDVKKALTSETEFAFFDVREESDYAKGHILYAAHLPYGRIELAIRNLVPRRDTPVVLTDGGEGLAEDAAAILRGAGYGDVRLLAGGNTAWTASGGQLFTGRNVPAIGFYEVVEHERHTPNITATDLNERIQRGDDVVILDTRPKEEFEDFHIPGAINTPGSEVLHRIGAIDLKPDTLIVTNCAGRTRSILGAQSLVDAGIKNPVASLTGGTMEWLIAGLKLEHGAGLTADFPERDALTGTRALADDLVKRAGLSLIDEAKLDAFRRDETRTLYLFDVRSPEEYRQAHPAGFRHAAGGQLSSGPERFAGTRRARIVLFDPEGVRDRLAAFWLTQLGGYEVHVLTSLGSPDWVSGPEPRAVAVRDGVIAPHVQPQGLAALSARGAVAVFDLSGSNAYRAGHIPGARSLRRSELDAAVAATEGTIVFTSEDGTLGQVLAARLRHQTGRDLRAILGGTQAWKAAGLTLETGGIGPEDGVDLPNKYTFAPERRNALFQDYLEWEVSLVDLLGRDAEAQQTIRLHPAT